MDLNFRLPGVAQLCAFCDKSVKRDESDVFIEKQYIDQTNIYLMRIWHKSCYDQYLDQGEQQ